MISHVYVNYKNYTNQLIYKTEIDSHTENKHTATKAKREWGRDKLGFGN